jgi:hypothetical protein
LFFHLVRWIPRICLPGNSKWRCLFDIPLRECGWVSEWQLLYQKKTFSLEYARTNTYIMGPWV